ncbi:arginase [uncultured Helcococcus sp.]|uniref:arginase n=1 Tax=uncultured Helcococcus sp. TaxID=1072508 RepID=UPI0026302D5A|nr:arginase [uncultured Helcococcus sp.]
MNKNNISILGIPMDLGASTIGTRLGPDSIRMTGVLDDLVDLGLTVNDLGNIDIDNGYKKEKNIDNMTNLDRLLPSLRKINEQAYDLFNRDSFPLILGGDHSLVLATFKAFLKKYDNPGLIYVDAHADINTDKTSTSGNVHGMPIAALLGLCDDRLNNIGGDYFLKAKNIVYIAIRDIDEGEEKIIEKLNIKYFSMAEIYEKGIKNVLEETFEYLKDVDNIYTSYDIDSIDMDIAPGTGVPVRGGLDYNMARDIMSRLGKNDKIKGLELVEVSPSLDIRNKTSLIAKELLLAFFGKKFI